MKLCPLRPLIKTTNIAALAYKGDLGSVQKVENFSPCIGKDCMAWDEERKTCRKFGEKEKE